MKDDFVVYVDFDSTLYDTQSFSDDLREIIANKANISIEQVRTDSTSHFFHPRLGGYEYEKHISRYQLDPEEMWAQLDSLVHQKNYLYPESPAFIKALHDNGYVPKILTFGEKRFQLARVRPTIPYLVNGTQHTDMEVIVVDKRKAEHIAAFHTGQRGVLIDDKPDQQLPVGFTEIHLNKERGLKSPVPYGDVVMVSSLEQAKAVIDSLNRK